MIIRRDGHSRLRGRPINDNGAIELEVVVNDAPLGKLLAKLRECAQSCNPEMAHIDADDALLEFISDARVTEAFNIIEKWYA